MSRFVVTQIIGVALIVLGGQGLVRLLFDHADGGLLGFVPGGFPGWLGAHMVLLVTGAALAVWAQRLDG